MVAHVILGEILFSQRHIVTPTCSAVGRPPAHRCDTKTPMHPAGCTAAHAALLATTTLSSHTQAPTATTTCWPGHTTGTAAARPPMHVSKQASKQETCTSACIIQHSRTPLVTQARFCQPRPIQAALAWSHSPRHQVALMLASLKYGRACWHT